MLVNSDLDRPTDSPTGTFSGPPNSRRCRTPATSSPWNDPTCQPHCWTRRS